MKPILFFLAMFAVLTLVLCCACYANDAPPVVVDLSLTSSPPVVLTVGAACSGPACRSSGLQAGQPLRNTGRVALAPMRAGRAVIAARPLRRVGSVIRDAAPGRRFARAAFAPVRWLLR